MALGTFVPGEYVFSHGGNALGLIQSDGPRLKFTPHSRPVSDTAIYGDTKIDGIYRGQDVQVLVTFKEWTAIIRTAIWPYGAAGFDGTLGQIGRLDSALASVILLTAASNSPAAAANSPATLQANLGIIAPENEIDILMGPDERNIPVLFDLLPYDASGTIRHFAIT